MVGQIYDCALQNFLLFQNLSDWCIFQWFFLLHPDPSEGFDEAPKEDAQAALQRCFLGKGVSENMLQIYRRTPMLKCDVKKEIIFRHECSPVHLLHILWTPLPKNTSGRCFWRRLNTRGFFYNVNVMSGKYLCNNPFVNYLLIFNFCLFAPPKIFICLWEKISSVAEIFYLSLSHFFSFLKKSFFSLFVYRSTFFVTILKARKFSLEDHLTFWFYGFRLHHNSLI